MNKNESKKIEEAINLLKGVIYSNTEIRKSLKRDEKGKPICLKSGKPKRYYEPNYEGNPLRNCCADCYKEWLKEEDIDF